jgi:hypothetical protein
MTFLRIVIKLYLLFEQSRALCLSNRWGPDLSRIRGWQYISRGPVERTHGALMALQRSRFQI